MKRLYCLLGAVILSAFLVLAVNPLLGADTSGKWAFGLRGGACKLVLTDHSDSWTPGWLAGADLKYGITPKFAIGVEGSWRQLYLADLSEGTKAQDGAKLTTKHINGGARQRSFSGGLFAEYHFLADKMWSPYVSIGSGIYSWKWADKDWNTLTSEEAMNTVDTRVPQYDKAENVYDLKDQQLYAMGGVGLEIFPTELLSFEVGTRFLYLTELLSSFTDDKDIVGTGADQLDLPTGVSEVFVGMTFHFGGKKLPPATATSSANPTSGGAPLTVQFSGAVTGGRPEYTYAWNFGDGASSTDQNPSHTYETVGDYLASLTVTDSKGNISQSSVAVTVSCPQLTCTVSASPTSGTVPLTVQFNGSVGGGCPPVIYSWSFGDGSSGADQSPSHIYQAAGDYTASLTVTDAKGNICQKSVSVKAAAEEFIPTPEKPLILQGVNFESGKSILLESSKLILDRVAVSLIAHPDVKVEVAGHCDAVGNDASNLKLSKARAKAVQDYLVLRGVAAAQLTANGYGESQPIADNKTAEGRAMNRRVELKRM
jgi:outer membrane protein OmpA-like peptidoglycan-associated protein/opacity protein-like surface antigen